MNEHRREQPAARERAMQVFSLASSSPRLSWVLGIAVLLVVLAILLPIIEMNPLVHV